MSENPKIPDPPKPPTRSSFTKETPKEIPKEIPKETPKEEPKKAPNEELKEHPKEFEFPSLHGEAASAPVPPAEPVSEPVMVKPKKDSFLAGWIKQHKMAGLVVGFVLVGGLMWGISLWRGKSAAKPEETAAAAPDEIPVNAVEVRLGRFQDQINAVGALKGETEIELRFEVDGKIQEFDVAEGGRVKKGQLIAKLSDRDAQLKVKRAKNELEQKTKLFELGGISKTQLDEASLNMDIAQTELEKTKIVAPKEGIIGDKAADVGEFVNPQRKIATLVSINKVLVKVGIIEKQVDKVFPGQKLLVTVDAYPGSVFEGTIENISPMGLGESKTYEASAKIPNKDNLLLPGMFARAKIITYEVDDAITVPNDALVKTTGGYQVFTINKDNVANPVDVEIGYVSTESAQIKAGLNAGDIVIVQKPPELKAGSKVKVIEMQK